MTDSQNALHDRKNDFSRAAGTPNAYFLIDVSKMRSFDTDGECYVLRRLTTAK